MAQSDEQYMRELYERFLQDVMNNDNSEFYEEDELLDIYDYAQDEGDDMVQLYVLLAGARLYPDSTFLDERKACMLSAINEESARRMFDRKGRKDSALWRVLELALKNYPDGNPEDDLADLLASDVRFSCEAIIRLIDTLHDLDRDDLIAGNVTAIAERTDFVGPLYYEAAETLINNLRYIPAARDLADELTTSEPFAPHNWVLLARAELGLEHVSEAVAAADYALAIDPANTQAKLVKGLALISDEKTRGDGMVLLSEVLKTEPDNALAVKALAEAYRQERKRGAAMELYRSFMESSDANSYALLDALKLHPDDPAPLLDIYARYTGDNERKWLEMAAQLANEHELLGALDMLEYYHKHYTLHEGMEYYLRLLYEFHKCEKLLETFEWCLEQSQKPDGLHYGFSPFCYMTVAASNLRMGNYHDTIEICEALLKQKPVLSDMDDIMRWRGMQVTLGHMRYLAMHPDEIDHSDISADPILGTLPIDFMK